MKRKIVTVFVLSILLVLPPFLSRADDFFIDVNSADQEVPPIDNGNCTLSEAIIAANTNTKVDECGPGKFGPGELGQDIIYITSEVKELLFNQPQPNQLNALPKITEKLAIGCEHATLSREDNAGVPEFRFFEVDEGARLRLHQCHIEGGKLTSENGGAIANHGTLRLRQVTLKSNSALNGGGIYNDGAMEIINSSIVDNSSSIAGAGIYTNNDNNEEITGLINSTIAHNSATSGRGGGVFILNSTTFVEHVTITENISSYGGGIYADSEAVVLLNSIVAGNDATEAGPDCYGDIGGLPTNIVGDLSSCNFGIGVYYVGDPLLGEMTQHLPIGAPPEFKLSGGLYFPLLSQSPAINTASQPILFPVWSDKDQLMNLRPDLSDMGAVEAHCGDMIVHTELDEECDDGNLMPLDGCDELCKVEEDDEEEAVCGNGVLELGEECDDGNVMPLDGCDELCKVEEDDEEEVVCGNGILEGDEMCDDGNTIDEDGCPADCKFWIDIWIPAECGDNMLDVDEACDDGNLVDDDGCSSSCELEEDGELTPVCGNGEVETGEACDDGNTSDDDECSSSCVILETNVPQARPASGGCSLIRG